MQKQPAADSTSWPMAAARTYAAKLKTSYAAHQNLRQLVANLE